MSIVECKDASTKSVSGDVKTSEQQTTIQGAVYLGRISSIGACHMLATQCSTSICNNNNNNNKYNKNNNNNNNPVVRDKYA